jgi:hypothetical protein
LLNFNKLEVACPVTAMYLGKVPGSRRSNTWFNEEKKEYRNQGIARRVGVTGIADWINSSETVIIIA